MNLIIQNSNNIVWLQTNGEITQANNVYVVDGVSVGIPVEENTVVKNAAPLTYAAFFPQTYTYINGVWGIGNQEFYDVQIGTYNSELKANCKAQASSLLSATDWTTIPDITNTANNPYLLNQAEFIAYRNTVRALAVNPVTNPIFPAKPTEQWSS
jgi:hypothetical protein